jgi:hypothetical protein
LTGTEVIGYLSKHDAQNDVTRFIAKKISTGTNSTYSARVLFRHIREDKKLALAF